VLAEAEELELEAATMEEAAAVDSHHVNSPSLRDSHTLSWWAVQAPLGPWEGLRLLPMVAVVLARLRIRGMQ